MARFDDRLVEHSGNLYPGIPLAPTTIQDKEEIDPLQVTELTLEFASDEGGCLAHQRFEHKADTSS